MSKYDDMSLETLRGLQMEIRSHQSQQEEQEPVELAPATYDDYSAEELNTLKKANDIKIRKAAQAAYDEEHPFVPPKATDDMGGFEKFAAGMGSAAVSTGRNLTNILLPDFATPDFATDEAIHEQQRMDQALMDTFWGLAGNITGNVGLALTGGGAVGGGLKGLSKLNQAKMLPKAAAAITKSPTKLAMTEGAGIGTLLSQPGSRLESAAAGTLLGGGLTKAMEGLGPLLKAHPMIKPSQAMKEADEAGNFMGLAGAENPAVAKFYQEVLPRIPGGVRAKQQADDAAKALVLGEGEAAAAAQVGMLAKGIPDNAPVKMGKDVGESIENMARYWSGPEAFGGVNAKVFLANADDLAEAGLNEVIETSGQAVAKTFMNQLKSVMNDRGLVTGSGLMKIRDTYAARIASAKTPMLAQPAKQMTDVIDKMITKQGFDTAETYLAHLKPYSEFVKMRNAARSSATSEGARQLKQTLGGSKTPDVTSIFGKAMESKKFWRHMTGFGSLGVDMVTPAVLAAGNRTLTNPTVQRAMTGMSKPAPGTGTVLRRALTSSAPSIPSALSGGLTKAMERLGPLADTDAEEIRRRYGAGITRQELQQYRQELQQ